MGLFGVKDDEAALARTIPQDLEIMDALPEASVRHVVTRHNNEMGDCKPPPEIWPSNETAHRCWAFEGADIRCVAISGRYRLIRWTSAGGRRFSTGLRLGPS